MADRFVSTKDKSASHEAFYFINYRQVITNDLNGRNLNKMLTIRRYTHASRRYVPYNKLV